MRILDCSHWFINFVVSFSLIISVSAAFRISSKSHLESHGRLFSVIEEKDHATDKSLIQINLIEGVPFTELRGERKGANALTLQKSLLRFLQSILLPSGYPNSVPPEYGRFQIWNIVQDFCSYLRGIMSTKAVLEGFGVGKAGITAVDATVQWVLRDGASMIGGLLFSTYTSANFGQNIKGWRLFADIINNVGITLDMIAPLTGEYFLYIVCLASVAKALCGVAAGATGSVLSQHWGSIQGNTAEVNSKNGAQHTIVSLIGLAVSVHFVKFANATPKTTWTIYTVLTLLHMYSNYTAMKILSLGSINVVRFDILLRRYLSMAEIERIIAEYLSRCSVTVPSHDLTAVGEAMLTRRTFSLSEIAAEEPILTPILPFRGSPPNVISTLLSILFRKKSSVAPFRGRSGLSTRWGRVRLWCSPSEIIQHLISTINAEKLNARDESNGGGSDVTRGDEKNRHVQVLENVLRLYSKEKYFLLSTSSPQEHNSSFAEQLCVCFAQDATSYDEAKGTFEAYLRDTITGRIRDRTKIHKTGRLVTEGIASSNTVKIDSFPLSGKVVDSDVHRLSDQLFPIFWETLRAVGWDTARVQIRPLGARSFSLSPYSQ